MQIKVIAQPQAEIFSGRDAWAKSGDRAQNSPSYSGCPRQTTGRVKSHAQLIRYSSRPVLGGAIQPRFLVFLFLFSSLLWAAPASKPAEYNVTVHVNASRLVKHSEYAPRYQHLDVTIDGKKYELESVLGVRDLLLLGDYRARLETDEHGRGDYDSYQVYEFQFPDKKTREFRVVGRLE